MAWFGDSVVVDEQGQPLKVYHGTNEGGFHTFEAKGRDIHGIYFARDRSTSRSYITKGRFRRDVDGSPMYYESVEEIDKYIGFDAIDLEKSYYALADKGKWNAALYDSVEELREAIREEYDEEIPDEDIGTFYRTGGGANEFWDEEDLLLELNEYGPSNLGGESGEFSEPTIYEVYLKIEDPLVVDAKGANWDRIPVEDDDGTPMGTWSIRELDREAHDRGHDGLIVHNVTDAGSSQGGELETTVYAVFKPNQIKVHPGNRGTFDPKRGSVVFGG